MPESRINDSKLKRRSELINDQIRFGVVDVDDVVVALLVVCFTLFLDIF